MWYLHHGGDFYFDIERRTAKYRNIMRDPRVSACIDGESPEDRSVVVYGSAEVLEKGAPEVDEIARQMVRRYIADEDEARSYEAQVGHLDTVIIKVSPQRIVALDQGG